MNKHNCVFGMSVYYLFIYLFLEKVSIYMYSDLQLFYLMNPQNQIHTLLLIGK